MEEKLDCDPQWWNSNGGLPVTSRLIVPARTRAEYKQPVPTKITR